MMLQNTRVWFFKMYFTRPLYSKISVSLSINTTMISRYIYNNHFAQSGNKTYMLWWSAGVDVKLSTICETNAASGVLRILAAASCRPSPCCIGWWEAVCVPVSGSSSTTIKQPQLSIQSINHTIQTTRLILTIRNSRNRIWWCYRYLWNIIIEIHL